MVAHLRHGLESGRCDVIRNQTIIKLMQLTGKNNCIVIPEGGRHLRHLIALHLFQTCRYCVQTTGNTFNSVGLPHVFYQIDD